MKLITRCPECQTAFRVHENQLAARQGKVRCGACGFIFDAFASLVEVIQEKRQPAVQPMAVPRSATEMALQGSASGTMADPTLSADAATIWPRMTEAARDRPASNAQTALNPNSKDVVTGTDGSAVPTESGAKPSQLLGAASAEQFDFGSAVAEPAPSIKWRAGVWLLALALVIQFAFLFRGMIAALVPMTQPAIVTICKALGCSVPLPRYADRLVLEASDLQFDQGDTLDLSVTVRNGASFGQAYPALLLTLTDDRNRPLTRRVLTPKQYLDREPTGMETIPAGGKLSARVLIDGRFLKAASYEVLVFYP